MKYVEIHNWKEYEKKKEWLKAIELLQEEMAYNFLVAHNKYSDVKYDENSEVDRDVVYIYFLYAHDSNKKVVDKLKKIYYLMVANYSDCRINYEFCLINEEGIYTEKDQIKCLKDTINAKKKLIKVLKEL